MTIHNQWDPTALPVRPGLYINFVQAATAQIEGGLRGTVGIPVKTYDGTAEEGAFYTIGNITEATELFGADNVNPIRLALVGGARYVLAYAVPETETVEVTFTKFDARSFNVFAFAGEATADERTKAKAWVIASAKNRKHFTVVVGGTSTEDQTPATGDTRSKALNEGYIVNVGDGAIVDGVPYSSGQYAAYIAGLIAGTPINESITYKQVLADDVTRRRTNAEIEASLAAGTLVLFHDGDVVKIEQGLTTSGEKIRKISARQQIATDIEKTARDNYIGRLQNNEDGQMAFMNAIKAYLEVMETNGVLTNIVVQADPERPAVGDRFFVRVSYTEIDSMEQAFLSINI